MSAYIRNSVSIITLISILGVLWLATPTSAYSTSSHEYEIKAAFLYNFMKFVGWPQEKTGDANEPIILGIIGKDPFGKAANSIEGKKVGQRDVVVRQFKSLMELKEHFEPNESELNQLAQSLRKCHLLFVCSSERDLFRDIIGMVKSSAVLTVGDTDGFLESGGIINFLVEESKIRFEINLVSAKKAKIDIRSQLLRLAKRVIE